MRSGVLAAGSGLLMFLTACSDGPPEQMCTLVGPPFGLTFDMSAVNTPPRPDDSPLVVDYCADDACQSIYVRLLSTDPAITGGADTTDAFIFDLDMIARPTAHVRLHDEGGPILREASTPIAARAATSDVNGPRCLSDGHWGAVRVEPDGSLSDVTTTTPMPDSLQPR